MERFKNLTELKIVTMSHCLEFMFEHGLVMRTLNDKSNEFGREQVVVLIDSADGAIPAHKFKVNKDDLKFDFCEFEYILAVNLIAMVERARKESKV